MQFSQDVFSKTVKAKMELFTTVYDLQKVILCEKRMGCQMFSKSCVDSKYARCKDTAKKIVAHFQSILEDRKASALVK